MTEAYQRALQWFADHQPVGWFDLQSPNKPMRNRLFKDGMIERDASLFARVVTYRLSQAGALALAKAKEERK